MTTTAKMRKHAALIRDTARERNDEELQLALAYADKLEAEAELEDALEGVEPTIADYAHLEQNVPVMGTIVYSGGVIIAVDHKWTKEHDKEAKRRGFMFAWEWMKHLHSPAAGTCLGFYAGTRESGPLVCWSAYDGYWRRISSKGDHGKNWASGGTLQIDEINPNDTRPEDAIPYLNHYIYKTFESCHPDLCQASKDILASQFRLDSKRIAKARAKVEVARLRQNAATCRHKAEGYRRQASLSGRETEAESERKAADEDAEADLIEDRIASFEANL